MGNTVDITCNAGEENEGVVGEELENGRLCLERGARLSRSCIWDIQERFYQIVGPKAWTEAIVPNFVSNNSFIAQCYGRTILEYAAEQCASAEQKPLYIIECGAGPGKLAYLIVRYLQEMAQKFLPGFRFLYVISDVSEKNLEFCEQHESLRPLIAAGIVQTSLFGTRRKGSSGGGMFLRQSETRIVDENIFVICNYVLDTLEQDAVRASSNGSVDVGVATSRTSVRGQPHEIITGLECELDWIPWSQKLGQEEEEEVAMIAARYGELAAAQQREIKCLIPTGGIRLLREIQSMARDGKMAVLVGDKGYGRLQEFTAHFDHIAKHGSFSMMVNFHALSLWMEQQGIVEMSQHTEGFKSALLCLGFGRKQLRRTRRAFRSWAHGFGPQQFSALQRGVQMDVQMPSYDLVCACLRLSNLDTDVFNKLKQALIAAVSDPEMPEKKRLDLQRMLPEIAARNFPLQAHKDTSFELGRIYMGLQDFERAIQSFKASNVECGEHHVTYHNIGICLAYLSKREDALQMFDKALALKPSYREAAAWREKMMTKREKEEREKAQAGHAPGTSHVV
eukprot:g1501.t1